MTGLTSISIIDPNERPAAGKDLKPMITLTDKKGKELIFPNSTVPAHYPLPANASINVVDGDTIDIGQIIARIPQESGGTKDITGGLPRVADLFEARKPKDPAILAEITGTVTLGKETKGQVASGYHSRRWSAIAQRQAALRRADSQVAYPGCV